ncbi:hypothetical protein GIB67_004480 [Kingdonia uniflora]|uniref:Protein SDA1 n=1 Tax=Kingdonia uniflora TaxID=39325 RepID=A0A7J7MRX1_9MAGN|nr:hypothetical protein GIB67_004480 [Kingdonia uniflora]
MVLNFNTNACAFAWQVNIKRKITKEEKLALIKSGREDRDKFGSKTGRKHKKVNSLELDFFCTLQTGGTRNRQKQHNKAMPLGAKRATVARSQQEKNKKQRVSGKQFRGRKAWK